MYKFDTSTIVGSYIKQLLHSFNLPTYKVYTTEQANYAANIANEISIATVERNKLIGKIKAAISQGIDPIELKAELKKVEIRLDALEKHKELNVLETFYRNEGEIYPDTLNWRDSIITYPKQMTYIPYIKDGILQEYVNGNWIKCHAELDFLNKDETKTHASVHGRGGYYTGAQDIPYLYNKQYLNWTKNLKINNNIYDTYTHEYLGDYLRFQRDYNGLDLMPLYNCFSNRACTNLNVTVADTKGGTLGIFDSQDTDYKIYAVPVKLFKKYTIAIDCQGYVEMFCGFYDKYLSKNTRINNILSTLTYTFMNSMQFIRPRIYDKLANIGEALIEEYDEGELLSLFGINEENLKLFIKLPVHVKSSIVILEGDYTSCTNGIFTKAAASDKSDDSWIRKTNHYAYNNEAITEFSEFKPATPLQLLKINTGESYPFSDSLIKYLSDMTITHLDENGDNVKRVRTVMHRNVSDVDISDLWTNRIRYAVYEYMNDKCNTEDNNKEILGYITPDVEKLYKTNYLPLFYDAIRAYNKKAKETGEEQYAMSDLTKLLAKNPNLIDTLIKLDPTKYAPLKIFKGLSAAEMVSIDQSIASIDIYTE